MGPHRDELFLSRPLPFRLCRSYYLSKFYQYYCRNDCRLLSCVRTSTLILLSTLNHLFRGYEYVESAFITNYHCTQTFISFTPVTALKVDGGSTVQTVDSYAFGGGVNAPSVQVRWQSTDFQVSSTFSGSTFSGPTSSGPTSSGPTSSGPTSSGSALSQSRVGISIGLPLGILLLISMLITIIVWRRTRKTRHFQSDHATGLSSNDPSSAFSGVFKAELPALMS